MNPEFHLHDYSNEPRLRDMPRTIWNWPRIVLAGVDPFLSNDDLKRTPVKHVQVLSILFALWIPGCVQAWCAQGFGHGGMARNTM